MSGPRMNYKRYDEYIKTMESPVMPSELPKRKINLKELTKYVKENHISVLHLSEEEKENLIKRFEEL